MPKGGEKRENTNTQTCSSPWKNYIYKYRWIIFISLLFASPSCMYVILSYSVGKRSVEEKNITNSEIDLCEKNNMTSKDSIPTSDSTLFEFQNSVEIKFNNLTSELALLKQEMQDEIDKIIGLEKDNNIPQDGDDIETIKESMMNQFEKIFKDTKKLNESLKSLENDFKIFKDKMGEFDTVVEEFKTLQEEAKQQKADLEKHVGKIENNEKSSSEKIEKLEQQISVIEAKVHQQKEKSNKENKENEVRGIMSNRVDILQICVIIILFIYIVITTWRDNTRKNGTELISFRRGDKENQSHTAPLIISFNEDCRRSHEDLVRGFIDSYDSLVINNSRDMLQIRNISTEVFLVFVDFNERNIILEGDREPQQIKKETVEYIRNMGRTAVVIYHLHPDSRTLEDRLYSRRLTSIEYHPTLKELSSRDCVLSIDQQLSEYQRAHIRRICNR